MKELDDSIVHIKIAKSEVQQMDDIHHVEEYKIDKNTPTIIR